MESREIKDNLLFEKIATKYGRKDIVESSSLVRKFQLDSLLTFIEREFGIKEFDSVLEVGCGVGASSYYMNGKYKYFTGVDYSSEFIKLAKQRYGRENVEFLCANIKELKFNKIPDLIFGIGVLHHISDLTKALNEMQNVSKNETIFAFMEPNSGNLLVQILRRLRKKMDSAYSEDQIFFKKKELEDLFLESGFKLAKIKYQGYFSPPFAQVILNPQFIFARLSRIAIVVDIFIQRKINSTLSWNLIVIAKK